MRGEVERQAGVGSERRIGTGSAMRRIEALADAARVSPAFDRMYTGGGQPPNAPRRLLKDCLLVALYRLRDEFGEQLEYKLLLRTRRLQAHVGRLFF
jgi:hypothetical protein